jgi:hypothetical protein
MAWARLPIEQLSDEVFFESETQLVFLHVLAEKRPELRHDS